MKGGVAEDEKAKERRPCQKSRVHIEMTGFDEVPKENI